MKASLLKSISLMAFFASVTPLNAADPVVAVVNDHRFTYSEVMQLKSSLPKQYQSTPEDKIFPILLNQVVDAFLIEQAAKKQGLENNEEVKKLIQKATDSIISQKYLLDQVKDTITDASVQSKYNEVIKNFPKEKEVHLRHILVDNKEVAQSIIKALKGGSDFKKLAQTKSKDGTAKEGGDLGFFRKSELPKELADAAFNLTPGTYSQEPVKTDFGWHVLMVEEVRDAVPPKFAEIKNELKSLMTQEAVVGIVKNLRSKAKVALFDKQGKPIIAEEAPAAASTPAPTTAPAAPENK